MMIARQRPLNSNRLLTRIDILLGFFAIILDSS